MIVSIFALVFGILLVVGGILFLVIIVNKMHQGSKKDGAELSGRKMPFSEADIEACPRCRGKLRKGYLKVSDLVPRWFDSEPAEIVWRWEGNPLYRGWLFGGSAEAKLCENCGLLMIVVERIP